MNNRKLKPFKQILNENEITGIDWAGEIIDGFYINRSIYIDAKRFKYWENDSYVNGKEWPDNFYEPVKVIRLKSLADIKKEFYHKDMNGIIHFPPELSMPNINQCMHENFGNHYKETDFIMKEGLDRKFYKDSYYSNRWFVDEDE